MLGIQVDRLDYQIELVGAVDLLRDAVVLARCRSQFSVLNYEKKDATLGSLP